MSDNRTRIWFSLFVLAVFCTGLAAGVAIGSRLMGPQGRPFGPGWGGPLGMGRGGRGGPPPEVLIERLVSELALNTEQRTQVETVLRQRRERLDRLQADIHDRFDREQQELRAEIRKVLTDEQRQKFDRWIQEAPPRGWRGRGPRPPGGLQ